MTTGYTSPELIRYGAIEALTASSIKCTPGDDHLAAHSHKLLFGGVWEAPAPGSAGHEGEPTDGFASNDPDCNGLATGL